MTSKHTQGPVYFYPLRGEDGLGYIRPVAEDGREILHHGDMGRSREENEANAALIVEAFNVATETGMTPRQLADEIKEAISGIKHLHEQRAELLAALKNTPLPSTMGTAAEHFDRFYAWYHSRVLPAITKAESQS